MSEPGSRGSSLAGLSPEQRAAAFERLRKRKAGTATPASAPPGIPRRPADLDPVPASFSQERLWFLDQLHPGNPAYNVPDALRIRGETSPALLTGILGEVVRRHEALRTTFEERGGRPAQVISPPGSWELPVADLSTLPAGPRWEEAWRLALAEADRPFDLERGPLLRGTLLKLGEADHVLLLTLHHIVSDGWSMGVLVSEITALWGTSLAGRPSPLPELAIQYADFAVWQRGWLRDEALESQLSYWRERLAGAAPLELPTDRLRPPLPSHRGAEALHRFGVGFDRELARFARASGATPFMVLLAGFQALLGRLSGQEDLSVGTPIANRNRAEIESLIGLFVNTLVMRGDLSGDPAFGELLGRVRQGALDAYAHQDLPFDQLIQDLRPERRLSTSPLFQVLFALQNAPGGRGGLPGLSFERLKLPTSATRFDLELHGWETPEGLTGQLYYSTDLFDAPTIQRLAGQLDVLVRAAMEDPGTRLSDLPLLAPGERHQVMVEWNDTAAGYPSESSIPALFEAVAAARPDAVALEQGEVRLTYRELRERAWSLARRLAAAGLRPEERVAVPAGRSPDLVVAMLGILRAGGACLPLDPSYPPERLEWMVADAGAFRLDLLTGEGGEGGTLPEVPAGALAYVMYTSGSTGTPKGVAVTHRNVIRLVRGADYADLGPEQVWLQYAPAAFDASTLEIWAPLLNGGRLVLFPGSSGSLAELGRVIAEHGVTSAWLTAGLFHEMVDGNLEGLRPLRQLLTGGDAVSAAHARRVLEAHPGLVLIDGYGPTENTTFTTCQRLTAPGQVGESVPIGRPIANTRVHVLDRGLRPSPAGVWGELFASGDGVARGYLDRPELTAERFLPDPWSAEPGARMYRTGDLVRLRPDGVLEFRGRRDGQVKVRGFRIETGEIEAALLACPGVSRTVVVAVGEPGRKSLAAWWAGEATEEEIRSFLRSRLPEPLIPNLLVPLAELPLTPNGKVDRAALPRPDLHRSGAGASSPPATSEEEALAALWQEVLEVKSVGREDDFFALGGHSLLATRLVSRMRETFGVEVPLQAFFETPTVAALAAWIEPVPSEALLERIPHRPPGLDPVPASFSQERFWFLDQLHPGNPAYNIPDALRIQGETSPALLAGILGEVVRRHEALRTTFEERGGRPAQVISPPGSWELPLADLSALPAGPRWEEARRLALAEADRPFDLARGPLLRGTLVKLGEADHALLLTLHHIVSDGWSMGVLVSEITALWGAALAGRPSPLPELAIQYADFAVWQRGWLRDEALESQLSYWRERLAGAAPLELPTDRLRPPLPSHRGAETVHRFGAGFDRELTRFARASGATPFMVLLAGFQALLGRLSGQDDLSVGTPIANRNRAEIEPLIGLFVNTLVMRADLSGDPAFGELLGRVRQGALDAYAHQDLPFDQLVQELRPERRLSTSPLFQVLFALQNAPGGRGDLPGLSFERLELPVGTTRFDLELHGWETPEGLAGHLYYSTDLFDTPTIQRLAGQLDVLVRAALEAPGTRLSELPLLAPGERHQVMVEWNDTASGYPSESSIPALFEAVAEARPDAVALEQGDLRLTYRELRDRAWSLARRLVAAGLRPEERVAVPAGRSPDLVVAMLGILRAGGAYLPLDPSYPPERLEWMVADAGAFRLDLLTGEGGEGGTLPEVPAGALAYVMYTSGSTGTPKGVAVTHRNVIRLVRGADYADLGPEQVWLQYAPAAFDASTLEIWAPLLNGGRLVLFPGASGSLAELGRVIAEHGVTSAWLTAGLFHEMVDGNLEGLRPLRQLLAGGDAVSAAHARRALEAHPGLVLIDGYGPTENTTFTTCQRLTAPGPVGESVPIGRPIANTRVHVLDRGLRPSPAGVWGELFASGDGVARGYLDRPELTAERFLPDPWSAEPGARMYRTGDLVRLRPDGVLEYSGRTDLQVKIRGYRIEPGEVEAAVNGHPRVREAAVVARRDGTGGARLAAYVVWEGEPAEAVLREALRATLPAPMVPAAFVTLDALPLTPNGKVDRRALAGPAFAPQAPEGAAGAEPATPTERELAAIWREVLEIERVGAEDDFFALGGHSLLAVQVLSRLRARLGIDLPVRAMFEAPTLSALALRVDEARPPAPETDRRLSGLTPEQRAAVFERLRKRKEATGVPRETVPRRTPDLDPVPASFAQERFWFLDRLMPGNAASNVPQALRIRGVLSPALLAAVLGEVVRRHESLRTTFAEWDGRPIQEIVPPPAAWPLPGIDLAGLPEPLRAAELRRLGQEEIDRPFDLACGPLFRSTLVRLGPEGHGLFLVLHHIVSDGWSLGVLVREITALYTAGAAGLPSPLPELPVQYGDFALWQRGWLAGGVLERQLDYWRRRLAGSPAVLPLPLDHPRPATPAHRGGGIASILPADLARDLARVARSREMTLYMVLLAGLQALLSRLTGEEDIPVGSPIANRTRAELEPLIGLFVNTLVLRGDLSGNPGFGDLLALARATTLEAYAHQDLPFEQLVEELRPERQLAVSPLFQVLLVVQNAPLGEAELAGLSLVHLDLETRVAQFDLSFTFQEIAEGLLAEVVYDAGLFDPPTALRLASQFETILRTLAADPDLPFSAAPLLSAPELQQVVREGNDTTRTFGSPALAHGLVARQAALTPEAIAVEHGEERLSYAGLLERARRLAGALREAGVRPDEPVALWTGRSLVLPVSVLAVLEAGGACLPLDPSYPAERLRVMIADARPRLLLAEKGMLDSLPPGLGEGLEIVKVGTDAEPVSGIPLDPENLAYVLYTSGSTGRPKGVAMPHRALANLAAWAAEVRPEPARVLQFSPLGFDVSFEEMFSTWAVGGTLVLMPEEARQDPAALLALLVEKGIGRLFLPFVALQQLAETAGNAGAPPALREGVTAGEQLRITPAVAGFFRGGARLFNEYGPTETHVTTAHLLAGPASSWPPLPPIGRPLANHRALLLDRGLRPVPPGVAGELCVGGAGLARGYLGRPELTAERFVPDPSGGEPGARLYRTGDLARRRADGDLEYLGRTDLQVKIRGYRVEPGEVEAAVNGHPRVREAAVVARRDGGGARLAAYVVWEGEPSEAVLREALRAALPAPMVPAVFVTLDALPLTPSGKVDRRALAGPAFAPRTPEGASGAEPATPTERELAAIWHEVLGIDQVGAEDDFFDLGGHSLLAVQVLSRLRARLGIDLPVRAMFEAPTLSALARRADEAGPAAPETDRRLSDLTPEQRAAAFERLRQRKAGTATPASAAPGIPRRPADLDPVPASFSQERFWFLDQLHPGNPAYNIPDALRIQGETSPALLAGILGEVVRRHEALRTTFAERGGRPVQVISPPSHWELPLADLSALPAGPRWEEARRLALAEADRPFDLQRGPLLRGTLLKLGEADHALLLTLHHIVSDGWSMGVLVSEITALWGAALAGRPSPLPELAIQYADFAVWQRGWLRDEALESQLSYWREQLAGAASLELPTDRPRPPLPSHRGAEKTHRFGAGFDRELTRFARASGATPFMVLLAGFQALLGRLSGQDDLSVGTPIANRNRAEIEPLIGLFVNTLVMRADLSGDPTFGELLGRVRQGALDAYAHQDLPFDQLVQELRPERRLSTSPLFQVLFALQNAPGGRGDLPGLSFERLELPVGTTRFDLELHGWETPEGLAGHLYYSTDLFDTPTIQRLAGQLDVLVRAALEAPGTRLSELPLLAPGERHQVMVEWNDTASGYPSESSIPALFEAIAAARPDAVAVEQGDLRLTYRELRDRAWSLARRLAAAGLRSEDRVAVPAGRSPDLVVAMLGILRAGGAYLPLDPAYPSERLEWMMADSGATRLDLLAGEEDGTLPEVPAGSLAYVMYTSGSTGTPKGVAVTHRNVIRLVRGAHYADLGPEQVWLQYAPAAFDASTLEIWAPLLNGGRVVLFPGRSGSLAELARVIAEHGVTSAWLTAGLFHEMVDGDPAGLRPLRQLLAGGDVVSAAHARRALEANPGLTLIDGYGPTENTTFTTCHRLTDPEQVGESVPIGRPVSNTRVHVLDRGLRPCPAGVWGELFASGDGVARGYLDRPELTAERFLPDPWSAEPGARMYRTGDLVRLRPDGALEFQGRGDGQVKIRGFRIETGEIEAALLSCPGVSRAVVMAVGEPGPRSLAAWWVGEAREEEIRAFLRDRLPEPLIPTFLVPLAELPLTANGKVDRAALPRPDLRRSGSGASSPPATPGEEALAALWHEVLEVESVGREDDFFALGGHSLLATRLVSRMRETFGVEVPLRTVFETPTLAALAAWIEPKPSEAAPVRLDGLSREQRARLFEEVRRRREKRSNGPKRIPRRPPDLDPVPASFAQERLWFLDRLEPGNTAFNMGSSLRLRGRLDVGALERALQEVVRRHESLRTLFVEVDGRPAQRIAPALEIPLALVDLSALPEEHREAEAGRVARASLASPFDLERGPLLRASLLRLAPGLHTSVLEIHHIITDGWSASVMTRELMALYAAFTAGRPSPLPPLPLQYSDFALWQREWLRGETLETQLAYWRGKLGGGLPPLDLPTDRPRPAVQTFRGGMGGMDLPGPAAESLRRISRDHGASLFMTLLAAFKVLLSRLSGQDDVIVGSPMAGRHHSGTEGLIGFFLNTLALRTSLAGNPPLRELLERVRETTLGAYSHQDIPFEALLAELKPERDLSRTPVFQVFFNLLNLPGSGGSLPGLEVEPGPAPEPESKFDLTFYVAEAPEGIRFHLVYNADLFDPARMAEFLRQYRQVLETVAADPGRRIEDLSLVTPEAARLLPDPSRPLPAEWPGAVHERFLERARRHPERPAAFDDRGAWTWGDLDAASGRLAARLLDAGCGPDAPVAVWAHRSASLAVALLGALRAGAPFVVLDPAYPPARLAAVVEKARPRAWVMVPGAPPVTSEITGASPVFEIEGPGLAVDPGTPCAAVHPDSPAWIAFTSGSTGEPKGIVGTHRPLSHFLAWHAETFGLGEDDRFSLLSGLAHDPLLRDVFTPLWVGGELRVPDPGRMGEPGWLADWFARQGITVAHLTPAMGRLLATGGGPLLSLRLVASGGEALTGEDVARLRRIAPRARLVNFYGATETPQAMGWKVVEEAAPRIPLGRGIDGVDLLVLGRSGKPAGLGELGEISIRTPYLAQGYLDDPVGTAERFAPAADGGRLYRTGDLGRYALDGEVTWTGRADRQVKIRGFRVEPAEVEAALARLEEIREAVVLPREEHGETSLVAYVVPAPDIAPDLAGRLRGLLAARLPDYLVPAAFVELPAIPLTPNGKVDRRALPAPRRPEAEGNAEPRTPTETALAALWAELLRLDRVGVRDNFFELGGHSLLATQLVSRMRSALGAEISLRQLFEHPVLEDLATLAATKTGAAGGAIPRRPVGMDTVPASFAQERLWFLHLLAPESPVYNMSAALRLDGPLDPGALAAAFSEVCRRHETLRTRFRSTSEGAVQEIQPWRPVALPLLDLSALPEAAREAEARRIVAAEAARPFDLGRAPLLLRALLLRLGPERHAAAWTTHHIVSDGWSTLSVLLPELATLYGAFTAGRRSPLPELPVQYADFALWQRERLRGMALAQEIAWWRERLTGLAPLDLPADRPRPAVPSGRGGAVPWRLPAGPAAPLRRLAAAADATPFMALFAAFAGLLHRETGAEAVPVGMPVAGRSRTELEGLIGFFVNTLVLRGEAGGDPRLPEILGRARAAVLGALDHQDLPFEKLADELDLPRNPYRSPLLRAVFQLQDASAPLSLEAGELAIAPFGREVETAKFDLVATLFDDGGEISGLLRYDADLFDAATIARLGGRYSALLEAWIEAPDRRLSDLPRMSAAERHQLLAEWNPGPAGAPDEPVPLHRLFEAWVDRTPDAPALTAGGETLSYAELDRRANRLARHLRANGVRPGHRVALLLERSAEMVAALLAVLKAGAAYVPVDPDYPRERIDYTLADSGASLVLTAEALETAAAAVARRSAARLDLPLDAGFPAYVIYTSGSTGRPKGVVVTHADVHRLFTATGPWFGFGPDDVWTLFHSYAFDFSVWEIWGALLHGGRLVVVPFWETRSPEDFYRLLRDERVTVLNQTPSAFRQLLWAEEAVLGGAAPDLALRYVVFGGEALEPASLAPWFARHGDESPRLINMYGITETTVHVTFRPVRAADLGGGSRIGVPIPDLSLHLLDADLRLQPIGVPGEIHVGGAGLALGYLGRPELTAERFVPDPFSGIPDARLYRSGDLARRLPDGDLEYLGRIDHQVKIRGFRIELGEIEATLAARPGVREVAVLARDDERGGERRLVAYLAGTVDDPASLRQALAERLPDYMVPSAFVFLESLPLTANGKVDRRALPAPGAAPAAAPVHVAPRTPLESFLAGQVRDVLGLAGREIGIHDDFFALGGTSITGAVFIHRLQEALGEIVHVVAIFDHPTVASLADYVREQHAGAARRIWGEGAEAGEEEAVAGPAELVEIDRLIAAGRPAYASLPDEPLNPPALFVLAPPRSGTTLLRVMLGSHPALFSPPELEMLSFRKMDERRDAFQGRDAFWLEGLIRAVMEARGVDAAEAERIVGETEREGWTTRRFYRELQGWLGGRMLVDKTPSYALDPEVLRQAEEGFAGARYLHLVRDPRATNRSFEEAKLDQIFFRRPHPCTRHQLAELVWTVSHRNILDFLAGVPRERWMEVRFEELVRDPERVLRGVCDFLGIEYRPEMADPYRPGSARMVDGPHRVSRMLGDVKFLGHGRVDPRAADRGRDAGGPPLGGPAREIARRLGYDAAPARGVLVPLQAGTPGMPGRPPLFCVHPVGGEVVAYRELARRLGPDQPVYGLQSPDPPLEEVGEMAERYLEALRGVQPEGPYRIAGWSMGGVVAYEMARLLAAQGETVEVLALIDAVSPVRWTRQPAPTDTEMVALFAADLAALHGMAVPPVDLSALDPDAALRAVLDLGRQSGLLPPDLEPAELRRLFDRFRANRRALATYGPHPYAGRVDLFRAAARREPDPTLGWGELLDGGLRVSEVPGDHYSILSEEVDALAGGLRRLLDREA